MSIKKISAGIAALGMAIAMTGCGARNVDIDATGAQAVPGAKGLYRLCDMSTLIYFTSISGSSDEYDAYFSYHCAYDKASDTWVMITDPGPAVIPQKYQDESEMNQQQERTGE